MPIDFTLQQTLDTVVAHLKAGGKQSVNTEDACMYRGLDGAKCFVGLMISDDVAEENEGDSAEAVVAAMLSVRCGELDGDEAAFADELCELQSIHDSNTYWSPDGSFNNVGWKKLKTWSLENGLKWPEDTESPDAKE